MSFLVLNQDQTQFYEGLGEKELIKNTPNSFSLNPLPPYERGGKDWVNQILKKEIEKDSKNKIKLAAHSPSRESLLNSKGSFLEMRSQTMRYLASLSKEHRLGIKTYVNFFNQLQKETSVQLQDYEKVCLLQLIVLVTTHETGTLIQHYSLTNLVEIIEEVWAIKQKCGEEVLILFFSAPGLRENISLEEVLQGLKWITILEDQANFDNVLNQFSSGEINLRQLVEAFEECILEQEFAPSHLEAEPEKLRAKFLDANVNMLFPMESERFEKVFGKYLRIQELCQEWKKYKMHQLIAMATKIRRKAKESSLEEVDILQLIALGRLALRIKFGIYPYDTQMIALLGMLEGDKGCMAQVKTGEGKSMLVALLAFVYAMQARAVDIISSSRYLAIRDYKKYANFFKAFGVIASHICEDEQKAEHFLAHIYYATATDLEFAIMREKLYFRNFFEQRTKNLDLSEKFDCVIVDELDNLMIDTLMSSARLCINADISYEWVYVPILQNVQRMAQMEISYVTDTNTLIVIRQALKNYMEGRFKELVPKLSEEQLKIWLQSAHESLLRQKDKDYIITEQKLSNHLTERLIVIVDVDNTGRLLEGCRWSNGVHEFLEVKHNIPVQKESLVPISMSHAVFYQHYKIIYGLSGTLGSKSERSEIKEIYGIDSFDVPPHRPSQRIDLPLLILPTDEEYYNEILVQISSRIGNHRPVLVLTRTIYDSRELGEYLNNNHIQYQIYNGVQEVHEDEIITKAGQAGVVTIATNTAGRGTDIMLDDNSLTHGGLHVILTFYPDSTRIEDQAIGRAGRQGQPGSSQIILSAERLTFKTLIELQKYRQEKQEERRKMRVARADNERCTASLTNEFFEQISNFHSALKNESFLEQLVSQAIKQHPLEMSEKKFKDLDPKDKVIAEELTKLLKSKSKELVPWLTLFTQSIERLENKALIFWASEFYRPLEVMLSSEDSSNFPQKARNLYKIKKHLWERYISASREGLAIYFQELVDANLFT